MRARKHLLIVACMYKRHGVGSAFEAASIDAEFLHNGSTRVHSGFMQPLRSLCITVHYRIPESKREVNRPEMARSFLQSWCMKMQFGNAEKVCHGQSGAVGLEQRLTVMGIKGVLLAQ